VLKFPGTALCKVKKFPIFIIWQIDAGFLPPCNVQCYELLNSVVLIRCTLTCTYVTMNSMSLYRVSPFTSQVASTSGRTGASVSLPKRYVTARYAELCTAPPCLLAHSGCKADMGHVELQCCCICAARRGER